jgi:hypothetical protein
LHGEHARAQRLMAILLDRSADLRAHRDASARDWLAAVLLAEASSSSPSSRAAELFGRLRSALGGSDPVRSSGSAAPPAQPVPRARAGDLSALLRDPLAVRDAVTLGALLGPRRHR